MKKNKKTKNKGWIFCSKKMPQKTGNYYVMCTNGKIKTCYCYAPDNYVSVSSPIWEGLDDIVAWYPKPKPLSKKELKKQISKRKESRE